MSKVLDEYKTSQINKMHRSRAFPDGECAAFFFSGWEQGFDEAIEYSKQEAIGFANFVSDFTAIMGDKGWMKPEEPFDKYTTEELYKLYIQNKKAMTK